MHVEHDVRRLSRADLPVDTAEMARYLIGKTIVRNVGRSRISGRIVETEAYPPGDSSGHGYRGQTARNHSLFLGRGFAYVYSIYGVSYMLNVSAEEPGVGAGVLLRALEPLEGINLMERRRKTDKLMDLARGPGGLPSHCRSTDVWMELTCAPRGHFGWALRFGRPGTLAQAPGSASPGRSAGC